MLPRPSTGDGVRHVEKPAPQALLCETRNHLQHPALEYPDAVIGAVDHVEEALLRIRRQGAA
jgi:hypothetical protein